jgi:aminomethyltransferase
MNRSPLHELNAGLGARFVTFGEWEMPVQYESVLAEHRAVRNHQGLFDVSHLGRFELSGDGAQDAVRLLLANDVDRIEPGRCQYTLMLNEDGGIVDDLIVWWVDETRFWVMPNAANHERVLEAFSRRPDCSVRDLRQDTVLLAVQGPEAPATVASVLGATPGRLRNASFEWQGSVLTVAGTGYTGEPGVEICADPGTGESLAHVLLESSVTPCGLGARDTLRLESGFALWGEDIDETTTPDEAGLSWAVSMAHEFVGRDALAAREGASPSRRLAGFVLDERGVPRHGHSLRSPGSTGAVTSGNISPMTGWGMGLGYLSPPQGDQGEVEVLIRDRWVRGHLARPPFHK